jgi:hypothetical protein
LRLGCCGLKNNANDLCRQRIRVSLQASLRRLLVLFDRLPRSFYPFIRPGTCRRNNFCSSLHGPLPTGFLSFEDGQPGFPNALLVIGGSRLGGSDIGSRLFHRSLSHGVPLGQDSQQWLMYQAGIQPEDENQEDDRGHGSKQ